MQEVKLFMNESEENSKCWSCVESLEKQINAWLRENPSINILKRETVATAAAVSSKKEKADLRPKVFVIITIWYEVEDM